MVQRRTFVLTGLAFVALVWGIGALVVTAFRPPNWNFMPGPLGCAPSVSVGRREGQMARGRRTDDGWSGFRTRAFSGLRTEDELRWGKENGLNGTLEFMHHLNAVFPPELYKTHPEYFPLNRGKRVHPPKNAQFWQPDLGREDVAQFAADQAKRYFDQHPFAESYSLGVDDGLNFGESPETVALMRDSFRRVPEGRNSRVPENQRIESSRPTGQPVNRTSRIQFFRGRPDFSRLVFTFMNRAAADLARSYPDKYLGCLAYYWCENTPPFSVDPHVVPFLTADRSQSYDPAFMRQEFDLQARWASALRAPPRVPEYRMAGVPAVGLPKAGVPDGRSTGRPGPLGVWSSGPPLTNQGGPSPRLGLYDYLDGFGFLVPRVPIHSFAEHIRHAYEVGFTDYYGESSRNWGLDGPMPWVIAQLLEDPEQNVDALLETYYSAYFQGAAEPMRQFFDRCEQQWMTQPGPSYWLKHYRNASQAALFPSAVCRELRSLLTDATGKANSDIVRRRVELVSDAFGLTERFVAFCEARSDLTSRVLLHQLFGAPGERRLTDYIDKRREFIRYAHELERRSPLAFYPINYQDWLRDDPRVPANAEIAANRRGPEDQKARMPELRMAGYPEGRVAGQLSISSGARNFLQNGALAGPIVPGRRIAGLQFGLDLPKPWQSRVEPTERAIGTIDAVSSEGLISGRPEGLKSGRTELPDLRDSGPRDIGSRFLRLSGQESAIVYQWVPATPENTYVASAWTRAHVSPSDIVELVIGWLDAKQKRIGNPIGIRLPEGSWSDWVHLVQGAKAPDGAAWVGIQLIVQHQVGEDWVEVRDFSLVETNEKTR